MKMAYFVKIGSMLSRLESKYISGIPQKKKHASLITFKRNMTYGDSAKILKIGIVGMPNAGKSSLINCITKHKVSAVSHVPHTTRMSCNGIFNFQNTQLVFTDTPGVVSYQEGLRLNLSKTHVRIPRRLGDSIDLLTVITDVTHKKTRNYIDENILSIMNKYSHIPSVLVMNKVDQVKRKEDLILVTTLLTEDRKKDEWGYKTIGGSNKFKECFYTSATTGDGVDQYLNYLLSVAQPGQWEYPEDIISDLSIPTQIAEVFREKLLIVFGQEIPWQVQQETVLMNETSDGIVIHQHLQWPKKSQCRYVLTKMDLLNELCEVELESIFNCPISLNAMVKHKKRMARQDYT